MKETKLFPGSVIIRKEPCIVLGEVDHGICVMVYDSAKQVGGLCHFTFPDPSYSDQPLGESFYGESAILNLLKRIKSLGATPSTLTVNVIGGSESSSMVADLARKNVTTFQEVFAKFNLKLDKSALGGNAPRLVRFLPATGEVAFKVLDRSAHASIDSQSGAPAASGRSRAVNPDAKNIWVIADSDEIKGKFSEVVLSDSVFDIKHNDACINDLQLIINRENPPIGVLYVLEESSEDEKLLKFLKRQELPTVVVRDTSKEHLDEELKAREAPTEVVAFPKSGNVAEITVLIKSKLRGLTDSIKVCNGKVVQDKAGGININTIGILAIGSSTGGPQALEEVLRNLPPRIPPIVISQHIPPVYSTNLADRLNSLCQFTVKEPVDNEEIVPGTAYFSPGGFQFRIKKIGPRTVAQVKKEPPVNKHIPSVDVLFYSVAKYFGADAMGVMLTGMGKDGAEGMLEMRKRGAYNIAQDEKTCVVFGMPKEAIDLGAVHKVYGLDAIPNKIIEYLKKRSRSAA